MKPTTNSKGVWKRGRPRHSEASQQKIWMPDGIAITMLWLASLALLSGAARPRLKLGRVHFAATVTVAWVRCPALYAMLLL